MMQKKEKEAKFEWLLLFSSFIAYKFVCGATNPAVEENRGRSERWVVPSRMVWRHWLKLNALR